MLEIRPFAAQDYPAICAVDRSLGIAWPERPGTPEAWAAADRYRDPRRAFQRLVAIQDGAVVGFGSYGHWSADFELRRFYVNVEVGPAWQRQGVGAALYDQILAGLRPLDPLVLRADAFTHLPQGFAFLQKRGFYEAFRETPVHLDVASFDARPYAGLEADLLARGIVLTTLRELESDPGRDRKVYDLYWAVSEDVPQEDFRLEPPGLEEWRRWGLDDPTLLPDAYFLAVRGDEYLGLSEWYCDPGGKALLGGLLGVRRAGRRQGLALAMLLRAIAYARQHGQAEVKTCTAAHNAPMQALFGKLAFARYPEWQQCQKDAAGRGL